MKRALSAIMLLLFFVGIASAEERTPLPTKATCTRHRMDEQILCNITATNNQKVPVKKITVFCMVKGTKGMDYKQFFHDVDIKPGKKLSFREQWFHEKGKASSADCQVYMIK